MLSHEQLAELYRSLRDASALSVYLDTAEEDPAARGAWIGPLKHALHAARESAGAGARTESAAFDAAAGAVLAHVEALGAPGWVAFASDGAIRHAEAVRVRVATMASWGRGIRVAPYLRVQAAHISALALIVDHRSARAYRYVDGSLDRIAHVHAHAHREPPMHMGAASRQGFHPGTRGTTGTDEAERELLAGFDRMLSDVVDRVAHARRPGDWIVIGGTPQPAIQLLHMLESRMENPAERHLGMPTRTVGHAPALHDTATDAEIGRATELAVSDLRMAAADAAVTELVESAGPHGQTVVGLDPARAALADKRVHHLIVAADFIDADPLAAEAIIGAALDQGARVDAITGPPAVRLASHGGVGALLRYPS